MVNDRKEPIELAANRSELHRKRRFGTKHLVGFVLTCALAGVWAMFFRPHVMGGSISTIAVSGESMLPTFQPGDLLIMKHQNSYNVGDIVVYLIPQDDVGGGRKVVHRIVGGDANGFEMRGDNNTSVDPWYPTQSQILGREWFRISGLARMLSHLRDPFVLAIAIALTTLMVTLAPATARCRSSGRVKK